MSFKAGGWGNYEVTFGKDGGIKSMPFPPIISGGPIGKLSEGLKGTVE